MKLEGALFTFVRVAGVEPTNNVAERLDAYREERYGVPPVLRRMVAAGHHGRKSGRGFYDYSVEPPTPVDLGL